MRKKTLLFVLISLFFNLAHAAYLRDVPRQLIQPNGDTLHCFTTGDEFYSYLHDENGYTIVQDEKTGYFVYATKAGDAIIPTTHIAGKTNPAAVNLTPHAIISAKEWQLRRDNMMNAVPSQSNSKSSNRNKGHINNLVISIRFNGDADIATPFNTLESMFNDSSTVTSNSMYNYFKTASYNQLSIISYFYPQPDSNVVLSYEDIYPRNYYLPYSATNPEGYTERERNSREFALLARAVEYVKDSIPADLNLDYDGDGRVDNICFVVKGSVGDWSDLLWPHRWSLYGEDAYIGDLRVWDFNFQLESSPSYFNNSVLCHEMFHTLSAPDLYRYYEHTDVHPVGTWDLMEVNTKPPQHSTAYMKMKYGNWVDSIPEITAAGTYSLRPVGSATPDNIAYKIASSDSNQFYVLEFRDKTLNFESGIPGSGLLIYRIDTRFNGNASFNNEDIFDELYVFRPNGSATTNGNYNSAHFGAHVNRPAFNSSTNPSAFLTQGLVDLLDISDITIQGDSLVFTYNKNPEIFISENLLTLTSQEGSFADFNIISSVAWQITGGRQGWLSWSPESGTGSKNIRVFAESANPTTEMRCDTLIISSPGMPDLLLQVFQNDLIFIVPETQISFPPEGGQHNFEIISDINWRFFEIPSWITVSPPQGQGSASPVIKATSYDGEYNRTERLRLYSPAKTVYIDVVQHGWGTIGLSANQLSTLSIFPNPVNNVLNIRQTNTNAAITKVEIFDLAGRLLYTEITNDISVSLSIGKLSQGIYLTRIHFEDGRKENVKLMVD
ncbi:M6 family metalloprotease domain-containing protein [Bacteroidales bacterium OttesenSCG-928-B11]|nr:M6 family metalloprotease domain-containing protein [Bacteroidales bacterium OttesenSCG-928-E04]MDL2312296.1 M6 family metalloprotease domain-containing protein [Bacteroidales bacterium OttesenSCG-928-B11]